MSNAPKGALDTTPYWAASLSSPALRAARPRRARRCDRGRGRHHRPDRRLSAGHAPASASSLLERGALRRDRHRPHHRAPDDGDRHAARPSWSKRFGRAHAQAVWDAGLAAIAQIDAIVRGHGIDCGFDWVDGYLHAPLRLAAGRGGRDASRPKRRWRASWASTPSSSTTCRSSAARASASTARRASIRASTSPASPRAIVAAGGRIYEHSAGRDVQRRAARRHGQRLRGDRATTSSSPPTTRWSASSSLPAPTLFQTKLALYTSYVVGGARAARAACRTRCSGTPPIRTTTCASSRIDDHDIVIFGGEDHKTGQVADTPACYARARGGARARCCPDVESTHRWSGQVIETPDGLPYIGAMAEHQYAATGFAGNGMTFGTLGAMMCADAILGRANPWAELFAPGSQGARPQPVGLRQGERRLPVLHGPRSVRRRRGPIAARGAARPGQDHRATTGQKVAAYRDEDGVVTLRSAICTHMGCLVGWNPAERTWDCPCHGSRFTPRGEVISGPAEAPLPPVEP